MKIQIHYLEHMSRLFVYCRLTRRYCINNKDSCVSTWRKIQSLGLVHECNTNEEVKLFCGMLDGLSFLPLAQVEEGMEFLLQNVPNIQGNN